MHVSMAIEDGLAIVTLCRPEAGNALDGQSSMELRQIAMECHLDPSVRAVLLQAEGKNFCVGGDMGFVGNHENRPWAIKSTVVDFHLAIQHFAEMDAPLIVAVNGVAAGAGLALAALGDYVVGAQGSRYAFAYNSVGLSGDGGITWTLPRLIGMRHFKTLSLRTTPLSAYEAKDMSIITQVVPDDELMDSALSIAGAAAKGPTRAFGAIRRLGNAAYHNNLSTHLDAEAEAITRLAASHDLDQGIKAIFAKEQPRFEGR